MLYGVYDISKEITPPCGQKAWNMFRLCIKLGKQGGENRSHVRIGCQPVPSGVLPHQILCFMGVFYWGIFMMGLVLVMCQKFVCVVDMYNLYMTMYIQH